MKKQLILILIGFYSINLYSQSVGIGTLTPNASAQLDVSATNKGLLIPHINLTSISDLSTIPSPAAGLLVYNTNTNTAQMPDGGGFYFYSGGRWIKLINNSPSGGNAWFTNGNGGTNSSNFIGTTDFQPLRFKINGVASGIIDTSNTALGMYSLDNNINNGAYNTGIGFSSLKFNKTGHFNTGVGGYSMFSNTSGSANTAIGYNALLYDSSAYGNTAIGGASLAYNISGNYNTAAGVDALFSNTYGYSNVGMGIGALFSNTVGSNLVAIGDSALYNDVASYGFINPGTNNTAIGSKTLYTNTTGLSNVAVGYNALYSNNGSSNTALGSYAMYSMQGGSSNIAIGSGAFNSAVSGNDNVVIGYYAIPYGSTGSQNIAVGSLSLTQNTSGGNNVMMGFRSGYNNNSGSSNTGIGGYALENIYSAFRNTAIGYSAGQKYTTGNYCTFVGSFADMNSSGYSNSSVIGDGAVISASNMVRIGDGGVTSIGGQVGWSTFSDARFKMNIEENIPGLAFILKLRPVSYQYNMGAINSFLGMNNDKKESMALQQQTRYSGFLAQEVEAVSKSLGYDFSGVDKPKNDHDHYKLRYAEFVVPMVKAMQEQQKIIDKLQEQNNALIKRLEAIEAKLK